MGEDSMVQIETEDATARFVRLSGGANRHTDRILNLSAERRLLGSIPTLVQADLAEWSRADMDRLLGAVGRPVEQKRDHLLAEVDTECQRFYIRVDETPDYMDPQRWGFGEYHRVSMFQYLAPAELDSAYAEALEECIRLLGEPPVVCGPDAVTMWCRPDSIVRLSRSVRYSYLQLRIEPNKPSQNYRRWEWKYSDDVGWEDKDSWQVLTDTRSGFGGFLWGLPEPAASTWEDLERRFTGLLVSFGTDMPTLRKYVSNIVWTIEKTGTEDFVQGTMSTSGFPCFAEMWRDGEQAVSCTYPLTTQGCELAAAQIVTWFRDLVQTPGELRVAQAWTDEGHDRETNRALWAIRFGVAGER